MPTDVLTLPSSSLNTKWKEPYASASLNQRFVGVTAPGIYRGLRLQPDPSLGDRTIQVQADQTKLDHVAVYENASGFSMTYRDGVTGDIILSLAAYASITVVVCIFVDYRTGVATTGAFRVFTEAEFSALLTADRNALVVLGTVTVPAGGAIPLANISLLRRTLASTNLSRGTILNSPLVRNPGFESGETNATHAKSSLFWDKSMTVGTGTWKTVGTPVASGMKSIELSVTAGPVTGDLSQQVGVETAVDELFFVSVSVKQTKTISSGAFVFFMEWSDVNDALLTTTTVTLDGGAVDSSFRIVEVPVTAPAGASSLRAVGIRATVLSPSTTGVFCYIDNVDVLMEPRDTRHPYPFDQAFRRSISTASIDLIDKTANFSGLHASLGFDQSTPANEGRVVVEPGDPVDLPPALQLLGRFYKIGSGLLNSDANALKPRLSWDNGQSVTRTLLWESAGDGAGLPTLRQYVAATGHAEVTANARFDGTSWLKDINGQEAFKFQISKFGITQSYQISGTNTWVNSAWVVAFDLQSSGVQDLLIAPNKTVTVSGGYGRYKHGTKTIVVGANQGMPAGNTDAWTANNGEDFWVYAPGIWHIQPGLPFGKRITAVRAYVLDNLSPLTKVQYYFRNLELINGGTPSTFTANAGTDLCTFSANVRNTGDGPNRVTSSGTLPVPLAINTDYFLIVNATGFGGTAKLAASFQDAINGVFIDIQSAGTGTHTMTRFQEPYPNVISNGSGTDQILTMSNIQHYIHQRNPGGIYLSVNTGGSVNLRYKFVEFDYDEP